jgi:predicted NBD/HSP70 family sugar kinase
MVVDPPRLYGWHEFPLRDALAAATGLPTVVDKDVTSAAVAEIWAGGPSGTGSFVFFYLGSGIGCGIVLNEEVVRGTSGNAGDVGHIITDPDGPPCTCGMRGCVAVTCSPQDLVAEAFERGVLERVGQDLGRDAIASNLSRLCEAAAAGNETAVGIIDRSADRVAKAVSVVTNLLDVERVVFGGPFWSILSERYLQRVPDVLEKLSATSRIHPVQVLGTGVGQDVGAVGAACLVLEHTLAPRADRLLLDA